MLYVLLRERIVERCSDPTSRNYKKVINMFCKEVEGFVSHDTDIIPRIGEIICLEDNTAYDVISVVHSRRKCAGLWHPEIIVEVVPHVAKHMYDAGNYSFEEDWPLISDLKVIEDE